MTVRSAGLTICTGLRDNNPEPCSVDRTAIAALGIRPSLPSTRPSSFAGYHHARNSSLPRTALRPGPRRLAERRDRSALRRDRPASCRTQLYKKHPANVVRLILNRDEPGDDDANNRYTRAAQFLKNWRSEGVLFSESQPAVYVYHQVFEHGGQTFTRRGFMARVPAGAVRRRARSIRTKRRMSGPKAGSAAAHPRLQGQPQPDLRPLSRPGQRRSRTCSKRPSPACRRSKRPTTWAWSIACGR